MCSQCVHYTKIKELKEYKPEYINTAPFLIFNYWQLLSLTSSSCPSKAVWVGKLIIKPESFPPWSWWENPMAEFLPKSQMPCDNFTLYPQEKTQLHLLSQLPQVILGSLGSFPALTRKWFHMTNNPLISLCSEYGAISFNMKAAFRGKDSLSCSSLSFFLLHYQH